MLNFTEVQELRILKEKIPIGIWNIYLFCTNNLSITKYITNYDNANVCDCCIL